MEGADVFFIIRSSLVGGTPDSLDGESTVRVTPEFSQIRFVVADGTTTIWQLNYGTDAENIPGGVVRPDDYNALTNAKVWKRLTPSGGGIQPISPLPDAPTNDDEIVDLLIAYGLCQPRP